MTSWDDGWTIKPMSSWEKAQAVYDLIQKSSKSPNVYQIENVLCRDCPRHMRDLLMPGVVEHVAKWNKANKDRPVYGDIVIDADCIYVSINGQSDYSGRAYIDVTKVFDGGVYLRERIASAMPSSTSNKDLNKRVNT